jgi:Ni,Fe-hydrogenase maturation factor
MNDDTPIQHLLVIGYDNNTRRQDGTGPRVAGAIEAMGLPGVRVVVQQALMAELAGVITEASEVVFIDTAPGPQREVEMHKVEAATEAPPGSAAPNPSSLLAQARKIFGYTPPGWILSVPAEQMNFGDGLQAALEQVLGLARQHC